jgi:hypothetical protein
LNSSFKNFFLCWAFHECMPLSCTMLNCELDIILGANCSINWPHGPFDDNENTFMESMNLSLCLSHCSHQCFVNVLLHGCHFTPCLSLNNPLKKSCQLWLNPSGQPSPYLTWFCFQHYEVIGIQKLIGLGQI